MVCYTLEQRVFLYDTYVDLLESVGENFYVNVTKEFPADKQFIIW
jgi:hypothetical protein